MKLVPGDYVHFQYQLCYGVWIVHFGRITNVSGAMIQVNTGEEELWVDTKHVVHEGERFQGRLI